MTYGYAPAPVSVLEWGGYAAGLSIRKYLANYAARVLHVESAQRPAGFRRQYPPFKDGQVGLNRSVCFPFFNDSRYGITLNLKHPEGRRLVGPLMA